MKNELGETELRKEPELVNVNGLQFKKYQMSWIRDMAKKYNHGNVNEFIIDAVLTDLLTKLEKLYGKDACRYPYPIREKLKEEGYQSSLGKVFKLSGARGKVVLDDLEALA
jgi:hypothetical protein